jgi:uncharacterized protein YbbK (DUF523 family)
VRYDGKSNRCDAAFLRKWIAAGQVIPVCPEVAGGLGVPRVPAEIVGRDGGRGILQGTASVYTATGRDITTAFRSGAERAWRVARQGLLQWALLKDKSPSCGVRYIYDGTFSKRLIKGAGLTATLLRQAGIQLFTEHEVETLAEALAASAPGDKTHAK